MSETARLRWLVKATLAVAATASATTAVTAIAQTTTPPSQTSSGTNLNKILVTGSRIPQTSIATAQPVVTISRSEINASGFRTIGQVLQHLPQSMSAVNTQVNNGNTGAGGGQEHINLHDLGPSRVLVLVNGQRWISNLNNEVDLSTIPTSVVSRIEVLMDGASSVYGSEAIAGVINIITVKNYSGAQASSYLGAYDAHGVGGGWDGKTQQYSFTVGSSTRRSSVLLSAGYYQQQAVWDHNRTISKEPEIGTGQTGGVGDTLGGHFVVNLGGSGTAPTGCGATTCDINGPDQYDPSGFHPYTLQDRFNYANSNLLLTPTDRWYTYAQGHYDLTDNVTFHFTTTYRRRNSHQNLGVNPLFLGLAGQQKAGGLNVGIAKDAPGNPFGVDLVPYYQSSNPSAFTSWCKSYGSSTCMSNNDILLLAAVAPVEFGDRIYRQRVDTYYFNGGFNGYFTLAGNQWTWNANYVYSQNLETDITTGLQSAPLVQNALGEPCALGNVSGCAPINLFGGAVANNGKGSISQAAANYVNVTAHSVVKKVLRDYNGSVSGHFWNGWYAGPWGIAAGYEYEETDGFESPDPLRASGNLIGVATKPTSGFENTNAQFAEIRIPFAKDMTLAKSLSIDIAQRYSQFHWSGVGNVFNPQSLTLGTAHQAKYAHSATPRVTFQWQPVQDLLIRGTWAQGFRIPSLSQLFSGASTGFGFATDPCAVNPSTTPRSQLPPGCGGHYHKQQNVGFLSESGGNSQLDPAKSTTRTIGLVFSPHSLPGFNFSADYFKTEITNIILAPGLQFLLNDCYINQNPESCARITVVGQGDNQSVTNVVRLLQNGGSQRVNGWDLRASYKFPTTPVGSFRLTFAGDFLRQDVYCQLNGECQDVAGTAGPTVTGAGGSFVAQPKHRYNLSLSWNYGPWSANWHAYLIGPTWENCALSYFNGNPRISPGFCSKIYKLGPNGQKVDKGINRLGTAVYNDIQASYTVDAWNTTFTLGVQNVLNKEPPVSRTAFADSYVRELYPIPGRFFYARIRVQF